LGQRVDTSLFEAGITLTYWQSAIAMATRVSPGPMGSAHPLNAPYQSFETADGWINVGAANQANWLRLLIILGKEDLNDDERFATNKARMTNLGALAQALAAIFRTRSTQAWLQNFEKVGIPAGPVLSIAEMHADPQTHSREMVTEVVHPVAGVMETLGLPIKLSETPGAVLRPAPLLGEHTNEVLHQLGFTVSTIAKMHSEQAVRCMDHDADTKVP